jgi:hypothetical protein
VTYYEATRNPRLLDAAIKAADAMDAAYGPGKKTYISGHEGLKIGLIKLYRQTGDERHWKLAKFFLDEPRQGRLSARGRVRHRSHLRPQGSSARRQSARSGGSRGAGDLPVHTARGPRGVDRRSPDTNRRSTRSGQDAAYRKTYVTGAIGSIRFHEQFGAPYELPNLSAWNETCAWLPRTAANARVAPVLPPGPIAQVCSSGGIEKQWTGYNDQNDDIAAVYDGVDPLGSADESNLYFRMRPAVGSPAWIEYQFSTPTTISTSEAYWVDDRRFCKLPASWRIVYMNGDQWQPVVTRGGYGLNRDTFNRVEFDPVTTTAVRIEVEPKTVHYKTGEIRAAGGHVPGRAPRLARIRPRRMADPLRAPGPIRSSARPASSRAARTPRPADPCR